MLGIVEYEESLIINPATMTQEQLEVYDEVKHHYNASSDPDCIDPILKIVCGTAGTGKSYVITALRQLLGKRALLIAPTGVAACNIKGATIHSALRIPAVVSENDFCCLKGEALSSLQEEFEHVKYIILDEMSMVGLRKFGMIDARLRQAFPKDSNRPLGGCSFIMFGDFGQINPVGDIPLYTQSVKGALQLAGSIAYQQFRSVTVLKCVVRQNSDAVFRDILQRLRDGESTLHDYQRLRSRFVGIAHNQSIFSEAVGVFAHKADAHDLNLDKLCHLRKPIARIKALHSGGYVASKASTDEAGGLESTLVIAEGARIMLTANLWIAKGLCNGTVGTVVHVVYESGGPPALPSFIVCRFPSYSGPSLITGDHLFPVKPVKRMFYRSGSSCSRTNIPLALAYGITIHKAQGLTLDKACVNVGPKEFSAGLSFVGLSRVRCLDDLLLHCFAFGRLKKIGESERLTVRKLEDIRLLRISRNESAEKPQQSAQLCPSTEDQPDTSVAVGTLEEADLPPQRPDNAAFEFSPLTAPVRNAISRSLGIKSKRQVAAPPCVPLATNARPTSMFPIVGDGNCFYRAISQAISGTEDHYMTIKEKLFQYCHRFQALSQRLNVSFERINRDHVYAEEPEIFALATMIETPIYVFTLVGREYAWLRHLPDGDACRGMNPRQKGIYLHHDVNMEHFQLVTNVET